MDTIVRDDTLFEYLLRLGDDALVLSQSLTGWCGHAPTIEVDLSLANLGLDLIGQATLLLDYAGEIEAMGRDGDALAFRRDAHEFRNCLLVEQPNGDFAQTIARQFLFSTWQKLLFSRLALSSDPRLAGIAAKAVKEIAYHADISADWVVRLGDGTQESKRRLTDGVAWMWRCVPELFTTDDIDAAVIARGVGVDPASFRDEWNAQVAATFAAATIDVPPLTRNFGAGRRGRHSEHLGHLLSEMQYLPRAYPDARW
jgi:ring-1,2-phenylacetyl-CoA epoxidase subunit PaaC